MEVFGFLREKPLQQGDDARIADILRPLNSDGRYIVQRWLDKDGALRHIRIIDIADRQTGDHGPQGDRTDAVVHLLKADGFAAKTVLVSHSSWGDIEVNERR